MIKDVKSSAAALYDGGWRVEDRDQLKEEYNLTDSDLTQICKELESLEKE